MELQKHLPILTEVRNLARAGFSSEEIAGLFRVKEFYHQGVYHEVTPEYRRLAFARVLAWRGCGASRCGWRQRLGQHGIFDSARPGTVLSHHRT